MEYNIREIEERDYLQVALLYKKLRQGGGKYMFPFYFKIRESAKIIADEEIVTRVIKPKSILKNSKFYVLEIEEEILWFIYWTLSFSNHDIYEWLDYVWWELSHLFVDNSCRWKWFSTKLRDKLFWYFEQNKVKIIEIWVNQDNPAMEIYKKWWFTSKYCYVSKEV